MKVITVLHKDTTLTCKAAEPCLLGSKVSIGGARSATVMSNFHIVESGYPTYLHYPDPGCLDLISVSEAYLMASPMLPIFS